VVDTDGPSLTDGIVEDQTRLLVDDNVDETAARGHYSVCVHGREVTRKMGDLALSRAGPYIGSSGGSVSLVSARPPNGLVSPNMLPRSDSYRHRGSISSLCGSKFPHSN